MSKAGYSAPAAAVVALSAGVAKTVVGVLAPAQFGADLKKLRLGFDGVTASAVPVQVEVCQATFATNPPGTNSTTITPVQVYGRAVTAGFTAASNWTTEPTVLVVADAWSLTPNGGLAMYDFPLGDTLDNAVSTGFAIRLNAPAAVNVRPTIYFERC